MSKSRLLLQEELYTRFAQGGQGMAAGSGVCRMPTYRFPPSLDFWRDVAGRFTRQLIRTPDLETLRGAVRIDLPAQTIDTWLARAPIMTGLDYLDGARLGSGLGSPARGLADRHPGPMMARWRPLCAPIGPMPIWWAAFFFHLVENKDADLPFAFLATYSTRLNQEGQVPARPAQVRPAGICRGPGKTAGVDGHRL